LRASFGMWLPPSVLQFTSVQVYDCFRVAGICRGTPSPTSLGKVFQSFLLRGGLRRRSFRSQS